MYSTHGIMDGNHGVCLDFLSKYSKNNVRRYGELIEPNYLGRATFLIERTKVSIPFHSFKSHLQRWLLVNCTANSLILLWYFRLFFCSMLSLLFFISSANHQQCFLNVNQNDCDGRCSFILAQSLSKQHTIMDMLMIEKHVNDINPISVLRKTEFYARLSFGFILKWKEGERNLQSVWLDLAWLSCINSIVRQCQWHLNVI